MKILEMENASLASLRKVAEELNLPNFHRMKKENLIINIRRAEAEKEGLEVRGGVLEITPEGVGFLRTNYSIGPEDVYVSQAQLRRHDLRMGDLVIGAVAVGTRGRGVAAVVEGALAPGLARRVRQIALGALEPLLPAVVVVDEALRHGERHPVDADLHRGWRRLADAATGEQRAQQRRRQ